MLAILRRILAALRRIKSQTVSIFTGGGPGPPPGGR